MDSLTKSHTFDKQLIYTFYGHIWTVLWTLNVAPPGASDKIRIAACGSRRTPPPVAQARRLRYKKRCQVLARGKVTLTRFIALYCYTNLQSTR